MFARDLLWKFLQLVSTLFLIFAVGARLARVLQSFRWQGPELTPAAPIVVAMALGELWSQYAGTLALAVVGLVVGIFGLWIFFEAFFRGGAKGFWIYAGSRLASIAVMSSATVILLALTLQSGMDQTRIVSAIVLLALWFILTVAETLVRRDGIPLLASDFLVISGAMGALLGIHFLFDAAAIAISGLSASLLLHSSNPPQFFAAAFLMAVILLIWTAVHSYLVVVRYSTIDIMRDNVVDI